SGAHDRCVSRTLASATLIFVLHKCLDLALVRPGMNRFECRDVSGHGSTRSFYYQINLTRIFYGAQLRDQSLHILESAGPASCLPRAQTCEWFGGRSLLVIASQIGIDRHAPCAQNRRDVVVHLVERFNAIEARDLCDFCISWTKLRPKPLFLG